MAFTASVNTNPPITPEANGVPKGAEVRARVSGIASSFCDHLVLTLPTKITAAALGVVGSERVLSYTPQLRGEERRNLFESGWHQLSNDAEPTFVIDPSYFEFDPPTLLASLNEEKYRTGYGKHFLEETPQVLFMHPKQTLKYGEVRTPVQPYQTDEHYSHFAVPIIRTYSGEGGVRVLLYKNPEEDFLGSVDLNFEPDRALLANRKIVHLVIYDTVHFPVGLSFSDVSELHKLPHPYYAHRRSSELSGTMKVHNQSETPQPPITFEEGKGCLWESERVYRYIQNPGLSSFWRQEQMASTAASSKEAGAKPPKIKKTVTFDLPDEAAAADDS